MGLPSGAAKAEEGSAEVTLGGCGERSGPTTIHIHINQESCLTSLWKAVQFIRRPSPPTHKEAGAAQTPLAPKDGPKARAGSDGEQKVLGGAQILLGAVCVALGVEILRGSIQFSSYGSYYIIQSGCAFWMGSVFIVAGIFSVVGARCGGFWVPVATFFNLASVVTGSVGFVLTLNELRFQNSTWYMTDTMCWNLAHIPREQPEVTQSYNPREDSTWREKCMELVTPLMMFSFEVRIILLVFAGVAVLISLFGLGFGLRLLCRRFWAKVDDYNALGDQEAPLPCGSEEDPERGGDAA